jgi:hypothetical protein
MIRLAAPEWLICLPLLIALGFWRRELRLWLPLRAAVLLLVVLVLLQPEWRRLGRGLDLWVLVDRSVSAADSLQPRLGEMETLVERSRGRDDRLFYIDYAQIAQLRGDADPIPERLRHETRTGLAIGTALAQMESGRAARLLVLTDGFATEPLHDSAERLARQNVALDYRLFGDPAATDSRVENFTLPSRAQLREPFLIEVEIAGSSSGGEVPLTIWRGSEQIGSTNVSLQNGRGVAKFTDRLARPGAVRYTARIAPVDDARPGNNSAERWIEITGGPRILLVTSYTPDPLAEVLIRQGFAVETVSDPAKLEIGQLSGARAVVLNNVPAWKLPPDFIDSLDFFVRVQGGGLLMAGGKGSFGAGGWFGSAIDELLPVSMELRSEHRKLAVAMAIVMDRSGSMGVTVPGGMQKMDLANEGAARSIELLSPVDGVAVFAVDTSAHTIVPLSTLGNSRATARLADSVRRITSGGGGICVPTGLRAARAELQKATAGQRHIVVFADANDATQELGDYKTLIGELAKERITISVIALGKDGDSGAAFLREVAVLGNGRVFFNEDAAELPALFAQETVAMARSAFVEEPAGVEPAPGWHELAARPIAWLDAVDGYNLSYLKQDAAASAHSRDEYKAPLVAHWQRGAGRVAAVSFPLGGDFSSRARAWPGYGDFSQTLARWLMGETMPPGIGLRTRLEGATLGIELLYDESWESRIARSAPRVVLGDGASGEARPLVWERLEPGRFSASAPLEPGRWVRGAVQAGGATMPFGPIVAGTSVEWQMDPARLTELRQIAQRSGGVERVDLTKAWQAPRVHEFRGLRPWLLILLLPVFLLELLATRLGWERPGFALPRRRMRTRAREEKSAAAPAEVVASPKIPAEPFAAPPAHDSAADSRRARFAKARRKG